MAQKQDFCHLSVNHITNIKQHRGKLASYYKMCNANQMAYSESEWNKDCNIFKSDILLWSRYIEVKVVALKHNNSLYVVKFYCQMFWIMYKEPRYQKKKSFCVLHHDFFTLLMYPNRIQRRYEILKVLYTTFHWYPCQPDDGSLYMSHSMWH